MNLCQKINKGPLDCSDRASVCRKSASGDVQVLGLVHTQKLDVVGTAGASWGGALQSRGGRRRLWVELAGTIPRTVSQASWQLLGR